MSPIIYVLLSGVDCQATCGLRTGILPRVNKCNLHCKHSSYTTNLLPWICYNTKNYLHAIIILYYVTTHDSYTSEMNFGLVETFSIEMKCPLYYLDIMDIVGI